MRQLRDLTRTEIVDTLVEVVNVDENDFLKLKETLTRIGVSNKKSLSNDLLDETYSLLDSLMVSGSLEEEDDERVRAVMDKIEKNTDPADKTPTLYQSCHILHKQGAYYIVHFKELYGLDGRRVEMTAEDYARRNHIARTLDQWGMCLLTEESIQKTKSPILAGPEAVTIIPHRDKPYWNLQPKYNIGHKNTGDNADGG